MRVLPTLSDHLAAEFRQAEVLSQHFPDAGTTAASFHDRQAMSGVCFALSVMWIARHISHKAEGPERRMAFLRQESSILTAMETQLYSEQSGEVLAGLGMMRADLLARAATVQTRGEAVGLRDAMFDLSQRVAPSHQDRFRERALQMHGLASESVHLDGVNRGSHDLSGEVAAILARTTSTHRHHMLSIYGADPKAGHALACYMSGGSLVSSAHLYFFDSNSGEFKVKSGEVRGFLTQILAWYDALEGYGPVSRYSLRRIRMG